MLINWKQVLLICTTPIGNNLPYWLLCLVGNYSTASEDLWGLLKASPSFRKWIVSRETQLNACSYLSFSWGADGQKEPLCKVQGLTSVDWSPAWCHISSIMLVRRLRLEGMLCGSKRTLTAWERNTQINGRVKERRMLCGNRSMSLCCVIFSCCCWLASSSQWDLQALFTGTGLSKQQDLHRAHSAAAQLMTQPCSWHQCSCVGSLSCLSRHRNGTGQDDSPLCCVPAGREANLVSLNLTLNSKQLWKAEQTAIMALLSSCSLWKY